MKEKRRAKLEAELSALEAAFRVALLESLRACAGGVAGLFAQHRASELPDWAHQRFASESGADKLHSLGSEIDDCRARLGVADGNPLLEEYRRLCGRATENGLGEARLAAEWLKRLGED
jgi:hypothetical protein